MKHFRVTGYYAKENISFIIDSYGMYEEIRQLSSPLVCKDCEIIAVSDVDEKCIEFNISPLTNPEPDKLIVRAVANGKPQRTAVTHNGVRYDSLQVDDKIFVSYKYKRA